MINNRGQTTVSAAHLEIFLKPWSVPNCSSVADFVTKIEGLLGIVETKTGNASLRAGQKQLKQDIENGIAVTPVGKNAEKAGLKPGQPIKLDSHTTDRIKVKAPE